MPCKRVQNDTKMHSCFQYVKYAIFIAIIVVCLFQLVRSKASTQGKHLQTHSSTVVLSLQVCAAE